MAGIYVHVPFCRAKCAYCDFYSQARLSMADEYVSSVISEYSSRRTELENHEVCTIYFGGGTPSALTDIQLKAIQTALPESASEVTIEVNPEDVTQARARNWLEMGFNRVSMGIQSLIDSELKAVKRRHSAGDALIAIRNLRNAGFENISCDLIYGLPGQTVETFEKSLVTLLSGGIEHLSAYILSYEPGTLLERQLRDGRVLRCDDDDILKMYSVLCSVTEQCGMDHYEISNFARPGYRSSHNSSYWDGTPYLGLGPGAHSLTAGGMRKYNLPDLKTYCADFSKTLRQEEETEVEKLNDMIMIRLRCKEGIDLTQMSAENTTQLLNRARKLVPDNSIKIENDRIYIPEESWLMADSVIRDLFFD